jgi:tetrahydromethanopterin S-methyltransferase subunit E
VVFTDTGLVIHRIGGFVGFGFLTGFSMILVAFLRWRFSRNWWLLGFGGFHFIGKRFVGSLVILTVFQESGF